MDIYKEKFTKLEREIMKYLLINAPRSFNLREIALSLDVSPTAIANSTNNLKKEGLITLIKNKATKPSVVSVDLSNHHVIQTKRVENLRMIYESGLAEFLINSFPGATIILYGSYSLGEDIYSSDIDIAIIESEKKELSLSTYEKTLSRKISIQFFKDFKDIHKNLKESMFNGIVLKGSVRL